MSYGQLDLCRRFLPPGLGPAHNLTRHRAGRDDTSFVDVHSFTLFSWNLPRFVRERPWKALQIAALIASADRALYRAKSAGRDRLMVDKTAVSGDARG